jgi:hypothetical protein
MPPVSALYRVPIDADVALAEEDLEAFAREERDQVSSR